MEPEGLLPHLQEPTTCPYPEPDRSSYAPYSTPGRSILILSSHLRFGLPNCLLPRVSQPKTSYAPLVWVPHNKTFMLNGIEIYTTTKGVVCVLVGCQCCFYFLVILNRFPYHLNLAQAMTGRLDTIRICSMVTFPDCRYQSVPLVNSRSLTSQLHRF